MDTIKDVKAYVSFRLKHLTLEAQKLPYTIKDKKQREKSVKQVYGRIKELALLKTALHQGQVKQKSKFYCEKVKYLKKLKDNLVRKLDKKTWRI